MGVDTARLEKMRKQPIDGLSLKRLVEAGLQSSRNDPKRFTHSSNLLGICYIEKGLYPLAIDVLKSSLAAMKERDESYWTIQYDLAMAYEKNNNIDGALDSYLQVYGWNAQFRDISQKINILRRLCVKPLISKN